MGYADFFFFFPENGNMWSQITLTFCWENLASDYCGILANSKVQLLLQSKLGVDTLKQVAVGVI